MVRKGRFAIPAIVVGLAIGSTSSASAAEPYDLLLPAGQACEAFDLGLNITANPHRVFREFRDADGNLVSSAHSFGAVIASHGSGLLAKM